MPWKTKIFSEFAVSFPDFDEFIERSPLYTALHFNDPDSFEYAALKTKLGSFQTDMHCVDCERETTFHSDLDVNERHLFSLGQYVYSFNIEPSRQSIQAAIGYFERSLVCTRDESHVYKYYFLCSDSKIIKVGQFPAFEDIVGSELSQFRGIIEVEDLREIRRATGLASHGVAIGGFVYLRRVFERLVYRAKGRKEIERFDQMRMDEKISALSDVLPEALVRHRAAYAIISKGIHELSEDFCSKHFPALRAAILMMAEQEKEIQERERRARDLEAALQKASKEAAAQS